MNLKRNDNESQQRAARATLNRRSAVLTAARQLRNNAATRAFWKAFVAFAWMVALATVTLIAARLAASTLIEVFDLDTLTAWGISLLLHGGACVGVHFLVDGRLRGHRGQWWLGLATVASAVVFGFLPLAALRFGEAWNTGASGPEALMRASVLFVLELFTLVLGVATSAAAIRAGFAWLTWSWAKSILRHVQEAPSDWEEAWVQERRETEEELDAVDSQTFEAEACDVWHTELTDRLRLMKAAAPASATALPTGVATVPHGSEGLPSVSVDRNGVPID
jgi:hypothetical protein